MSAEDLKMTPGGRKGMRSIVGEPPYRGFAYVDVNRACTEWLQRRGLAVTACPECGGRYRHGRGCSLSHSVRSRVMNRRLDFGREGEL